MENGQENSQSTQPSRKPCPRILIVEDDSIIREDVLSKLRLNSDLSDCEVGAVSCLKDAFAHLRQEQVQVVLLDITLEGPTENGIQTGIDAIPEILSIQPHIQILMFTASSEIQHVVQAMKNGAFGYIPKNESSDFLFSQIEKALQVARMKMRLEQNDRGIETNSNIKISGHSRSTQLLEQKLALVSESDRPVLLLGETGVGKTTIAKAIHEYRNLQLQIASRPFVSVSLSALNSGTIERELFGNEKGAFTDAKFARPGLLELVNGGTLFIDEIGDVSLEIQVKLLKAIEEKRFLRVGGTREIKTEFKLICATNRKLEKLVEAGLFREDLYMRLATFPILIPSLKDRREDIPDLIRAILPKVCAEAKHFVSYSDLPKDFIDALTRNSPRGNIRGLDDALSRLITLSPRNERGVPILSRWKSVSELKEYLGLPVFSDLRQAVTLDQIAHAPFDVIGTEFPGLEEFMEMVSSRVMSEASKKFRRQREMARILKLSESTVSSKIKLLRTKGKRTGAYV